MTTCTHLDQITLQPGLVGEPPASPDCRACVEMGSTWVTLRRCLHCGRIGCCDSSPNRHASRHAQDAGHPLVQSFEPGEDWIWCFVDEVSLSVPEGADSPSHP